MFCSAHCLCVRSSALDRCYIDALKSTEDLIFRLSLLFPSAIAEHVNRNTRTLTTEAAALCTSVGIFVTAWQQQQVEAGFEHANGRLAHSMLIDRLKNAGDYTLTSIDENGVEDAAAYNRKRKELNKHFSGTFARGRGNEVGAGYLNKFTLIVRVICPGRAESEDAPIRSPFVVCRSGGPMKTCLSLSTRLAASV